MQRFLHNDDLMDEMLSFLTDDERLSLLHELFTDHRPLAWNSRERACFSLRAMKRVASVHQMEFERFPFKEDDGRRPAWICRPFFEGPELRDARHGRYWAMWNSESEERELCDRVFLRMQGYYRVHLWDEHVNEGIVRPDARDNVRMHYSVARHEQEYDACNGTWILPGRDAVPGVFWTVCELGDRLAVRPYLVETPEARALARRRCRAGINSRGRLSARYARVRRAKTREPFYETYLEALGALWAHMETSRRVPLQLDWFGSADHLVSHQYEIREQAQVALRRKTSTMIHIVVFFKTLHHPDYMTHRRAESLGLERPVNNVPAELIVV